MRAALFFICLFGVMVLLGSCSNSDGGSDGGSGIPRATWKSTDEGIVCHNATRSWIIAEGTTTPIHYCEWNCAYYGGRNTASFVRIRFDLDKTESTDEGTEETTEELPVKSTYLIYESPTFGTCR